MGNVWCTTYKLLTSKPPCSNTSAQLLIPSVQVYISIYRTIWTFQVDPESQNMKEWCPDAKLSPRWPVTYIVFKLWNCVNRNGLPCDVGIPNLATCRRIQASQVAVSWHQASVFIRALYMNLAYKHNFHHKTGCFSTLLRHGTHIMSKPCALIQKDICRKNEETELKVT